MRGSLGSRRPALGAALLLLACITAPGLRADPAGVVRRRSFELLNEGVAAYKRGEFVLAVEKLEETAAMALSSFRAYYYLGLARIGIRDYSAAIESLEIALDLDPNHIQSLIALGDAHLKLGDVDEARAAYVRALKLRPAYAEALDGLARSYESRARDDEALEYYRKAIASDHGFAPAYTHLGDLYLRQDRLQEAVRLLEEAVTIRPDYAPGMNRLALAYGRLGMDSEAVATIQRAIELEPQSASHSATLGMLQLDQGHVRAAEESFEHALGLSPGLPEARLGLAEVARRRGEYDAALEEVDGALGEQGIDPLSRRRLEDYRGRLAEERTRVAGLEMRVAGEEATAEDLTAMAEVYAGRGRWAQAADLQAWAADTPERRERLAYMLFRAGRLRNSYEIYSDLANAGDLDLLLNCGVALARLGDDEAALETFDRILAADPDHRLARLYRGNALLRLGRTSQAADEYFAFLQQDDRGEAAERVRRIMKQIAPGRLPPEDASPVPEVPPRPEPAPQEPT